MAAQEHSFQASQFVCLDVDIRKIAESTECFRKISTACNGALHVLVYAAGVYNGVHTRLSPHSYIAEFNKVLFLTFLPIFA